MTKPELTLPYSKNEEIANAVTHGIGALLSVVGLVLMVIKAAPIGPREVVACAIYGASLILLFTASTLYHASRSPRTRRILQKADHTAIYLLIAGTYTPFALLALRGAWGWSIFGVVWGLALAGILFELLGPQQGSRKWSLVLYIGMGWVVVVAIKPLLSALPQPGLILLLIGGLCYTGGAAFYANKGLTWHHAIWHVFVLGGSIAHFFAVYRVVLVSP